MNSVVGVPSSITFGGILWQSSVLLAEGEVHQQLPSSDKKAPKEIQNEPSEPPEFELPIPGSEEPGTYVPGTGATEPEARGIEDAIELPYFGRLRASALGLPLFTIAVGLVDGFNPCAMWVLLFLLSILVNLHSRLRILAVAGTFVVISGVAYFAFMAAWLNVFLLVGLMRPIQIFLGILGITVGVIHIKDFFAFKQGISLSIPESTKPGIYQRVRKIVNAEHLWGAVTGAIVLAVLVNIIELLCTAGLPALFTQILSMYQLPTWQNYAFLLLYIAAYMFDDSVMVIVVVVTLGKKKLQEKEGQWLKLVSGIVIVALGLLILIEPDWLL